MFRNREDAAHRLAGRLVGRSLHDPLVLAIPRGGVVTGAVLARELDAELDVVLSRKLRAPGHAELALGAVGEDGQVYVHPEAQQFMDDLEDYVRQERQRQMAEIVKRRGLFRTVRPAAPITGRSVIVTDDGIATGSTMIAALQALRPHNPGELIVAVPVAPPERLPEIDRHCDELICLYAPEDFWAVGQFYIDFGQVDDEQAVALLEHAAARRAHSLRAQPISSR